MPERAYIICATPRSGSTLLCGVLSQTGVLGHPDSFYRTVSTEWWANHWGLHIPTDGAPDFERKFLAAALREGCGKGSLFGMRLMFENLEDFLTRLGRACGYEGKDRAQIERALGRTHFIHLSRSDKLEQAISWVKAHQSGLWHQAPDGQEIERLSPPAMPRYDAEAIHKALALFEAHDAAWTQWFAENDITPLRISYEDLARDPTGQTERILGDLGQDVGVATTVRAHVRKLADATSVEWAMKFRDEIDS